MARKAVDAVGDRSGGREESERQQLGLPARAIERDGDRSRQGLCGQVKMEKEEVWCFH